MNLLGRMSVDAKDEINVPIALSGYTHDGSFIGVSMNILGRMSWVHTHPYFFMGAFAPTAYSMQGSLIEGKGVSAPT